MLTKFNSSNDMNSIASDAISSYINDGYRIDAKESVIDRNKDKDCTFKAVLKKDVDGIELKATITITDNGDDKNKTCTYHKVETAGDLKWSEETRTFSHSTDQIKLNSTENNSTICDNNNKTSHTLFDHEDEFTDYYHDTVRRIFKDFRLFNDDFVDNLYEFIDRRKHVSDINKITSSDKKQSTNDESSKDTKCKSAYQRLDDYIKHITDDKDKLSSDEKEHIKVDAKDSESDIYNKIVNRKKNLEDACNIKANVDAKEEDLQKQDTSDDIEDSLVKLVRWIFGH